MRTRTFELESGASITMVDAAFDSTGHRLSVSGEEEQDMIDGHPIYGTDGDWPRRKVTELAVRLPDGKRVTLDVAGMHNPDSPHPSPPFSMKRDDAMGTYIVKGHFGDGHGSYDAEWAIRDDRSARTSVRAQCGVYAQPIPPDDSRLRADIPSRFAACNLGSAASWGLYDDAGLDMVLRLDCPQQQTVQVVLRYRRSNSSSDARWELAPRPDPFAVP